MKVYICGIHKTEVLVKGECLTCRGTGPFELAIEPGQVFQHYKGQKLYRVLFVVRVMAGERQGKLDVVYVGLYDNPHGNDELSRPVEDWLAKVEVAGELVPRFQLFE